MVIDENEAEEVRLIYRLYLDGYSTSAIANELMKLGIKSLSGKDKWTTSLLQEVKLVNGNIIN